LGQLVIPVTAGLKFVAIPAAAPVKHGFARNQKVEIMPDGTSDEWWT
jgi:hypothetical protein